MSEGKSEVYPGRDRGKLKLFLPVAALVVTLDQLSKLWVSVNLPQIDRIELLPGFLDLVHVRNTGAVFGLFSSHNELFIALSITGSVIILVFLYFFRHANTVSMLSFALLLGGAVGNLTDRIRLGYVIDFISIHWQDFFRWPAFNIADAAITVGIPILIYSFYKLGVFSKADERSHRP